MGLREHWTAKKVATGLLPEAELAALNLELARAAKAIRYTLSDLDDVTVASIAGSDFLRYDATDARWENVSLASAGIVSTAGLTVGTLPKASASTALVDSLLSESGTTVTVGGTVAATSGASISGTTSIGGLSVGIYNADGLVLSDGAQFLSRRTAGANVDNFSARPVGGPATNLIDFALSLRSSNTDYWLYGYDGTTYKNFIGFDYANFRVLLGPSSSHPTVLMGGTVAATGDPRLDVIGSTIAIANTASNATNKQGVFALRHYTIAEETVSLIAGRTTSTANIVWIGGGVTVAGFNAATLLEFYTAANNTTLTGTLRWQIDSSGHFLAGSDNTYDIGASGATRPRTGYFGTSVVIGTDPGGSAPIRAGGTTVVALFNRDTTAFVGNMQFTNFDTTAGVQHWVLVRSDFKDTSGNQVTAGFFGWHKEAVWTSTATTQDAEFVIRCAVDGATPTNQLKLSSAGVLTIAGSGAAVVAPAYYSGANQVVGARQAHVVDPTGGSVQDAESRTAIAAINVVLETHGLMATS